jgi:hypothetical protein
MTAVLSAAEWHPRLREAVHEALDRPLAQVLGRVLARAAADSRAPARPLLTLNWVLRGLVLDRLRSGPRTTVDLDALVDFLVAGVAANPPRSEYETGHHQAWAPRGSNPHPAD